MKRNYSMGSIIAFGLMIACGDAMAKFDGSEVLICAPSSYSECTVTGCERVSPEEINAPKFLKVNAKRKIIESVQGGLGRTSKVDHVENVDGKLILQGVEDGVEDVRDGLGYSLAISESTGDMVLSASGDGVGFIAFGACTPLPR